MMRVERHGLLSQIWPYPFETALEKGYPQIFDLMTYWILYENNTRIGYTGSLDMGLFHFVGNTYILPQHRKNGGHSFLLSERNKQLPLKPKITILNPIEESQMYHLAKVVSSLGYSPVYSYDDVSDIMSKALYNQILNESQQIWRMD
mgnify:CR=1 FL=1